MRRAARAAFTEPLRRAKDLSGGAHGLVPCTAPRSSDKGRGSSSAAPAVGAIEIAATTSHRPPARTWLSCRFPSAGEPPLSHSAPPVARRYVNICVDAGSSGPGTSDPVAVERLPLGWQAGQACCYRWRAIHDRSRRERRRAAGPLTRMEEGTMTRKLVLMAALA